jgi:hypothetical protein
MSKRAIPKTLRDTVWVKYIGEVFKGKCCCCKSTQITVQNFVCGHVESDKKGGEINIHNLRPICVSCNSSMGSKNMNSFMKDVGYSTIKRCVNKSESSDSESSDSDTTDSDDDTIDNLSKKELGSICEYLEISKTGTCGQLTKKIGNEYGKLIKTFKKPELVKMCSSLSVSTTGTKSVLFERIKKEYKYKVNENDCNKLLKCKKRKTNENE